MSQLHAPPSFTRAVWLHAGYELQRRFSRFKWLLFGAGFIVAWGLVLRYLILTSAQLIERGEQSGLSLLILNELQLLQRFNWPSYELAICWYLLELGLPLLVMLLSADLLIQDHQSRRLRFWQARSSRLSIVLGHCIAKASITAAIISLAVFSTLALTLSRQSGNIEASLGAAVVMCLLLFALSLPYIALMALSGLFATTPFRSLVLAFISLFIIGWLLQSLAGHFTPLAWLNKLLPGQHSALLEQCSASACLPAIGLPLLQTAWVIVLALWLWQRRDL